MNFAKNKTVLVTGATDGIGQAAALQLAQAGAKVMLHGRNPEKLQRTADWIFDHSGHRVLDTLLADFSSLEEVRRLANQICDKEADLQILINNAGMYSDRWLLSQDGFELTFQVNYLAPFLLTLLLEGLLKENKPGRVINVTSTTHIGASLDFGPLQNETSYDGLNAYETSKLALSMFTLELSQRWEGSGVTVFHVHPGGVNTKLLREGFEGGGISPEEGARPLVYVASAEGLQETSGLYFSRLSLAEPDFRVYDPELRQWLWSWTAKKVELDRSIKDLNFFKSAA